MKTATAICEGMEVIGLDGQYVGKVEEVDGDLIRLARENQQIGSQLIQFGKCSAPGYFHKKKEIYN